MHVAGLSERMRQMTDDVERMSDENRLLREQAGISVAEPIDLATVKLEKVRKTVMHCVVSSLTCCKAASAM